MVRPTLACSKLYYAKTRFRVPHICDMLRLKTGPETHAAWEFISIAEALVGRFHS
jgi:hypothetical protein